MNTIEKQQLKQHIQEGKLDLLRMKEAKMNTILVKYKELQIRNWEDQLAGRKFITDERMLELYNKAYCVAFRIEKSASNYRGLNNN